MNHGLNIILAILCWAFCVLAGAGCLWLLGRAGGGVTPWDIVRNAGVILQPRLVITLALALITILLSFATAPDRRYSGRAITTALLILSGAGAAMGAFTAFGHWRIIEQVKYVYSIPGPPYAYAEMLAPLALGFLGAAVGLTAHAWIHGAGDRP